MASAVNIAVKDNPVEGIQAFLKSLLEDDEIGAVLVQRHLGGKGMTMPTLVTDPAELDQADPLCPSFPLNGAKLVARLTRGQTDMGVVAAVLRPCEIRAFIELVKLNQGSMDNVLLIGVDCYGAFSNADYQKYLAANGQSTVIDKTLTYLKTVSGGATSIEGIEIAAGCRACEHPAADSADLSIGLFGLDPDQALLAISNTPRGEGLLNRLDLPEAASLDARKKHLAEIVNERTAFRDDMFSTTAEATDTLEKLSDYLSGCVNCYNCRVACPVCYCKECVFVTDVFDHKPWQYLGWARQKGALKLPTDTVFFHLTRLAHMSASCIGCGQCSNACPNNVPVMELFRMVAADVQKAFDYHPGADPNEAPPLTVFHEREFAEMTGGSLD